jgi:hypothetical protein
LNQTEEYSETGRNRVQRIRVSSRFLIPMFLALTVMIVSRITYLNANRIEDQALYHALAVLAGTIQFASVVLVAMVIYPVTYFREAKALERVVASSTNLAVWVGIDTYKVGEAFPWEVSLYYGVNIGSILFAWNFAQMGILELACRYVSKRRGDPVRVMTPGPFLPILVFLFVVFVLSKEGGAAYFNTFLDGYLVLFRD